MSESYRAILIQDHNGGAKEIIRFPSSTPTHKVVERWQRNHWRTRWSGQTVACSWQLLESSNLVDSLIESSKASL